VHQKAPQAVKSPSYKVGTRLSEQVQTITKTHYTGLIMLCQGDQVV